MKKETREILAPPPLVYGGAFALGMYLDSWLPLRLFPRSFRTFVGGILLGVGGAVGLLSLKAMRQANTSPAHSEPTTTLVVEGPYRLSRNPIYVGMTALYIGLSVLLNRIWPLALLPVVLKFINIGVIDQEEKVLEQQFGDEYRQYKESVPRWLPTR
ncbi:protein-S-isoprenylcysteine O-methyltransferase Ste14 [Thermosporothrix hazakensis]|jgi:protein-S-isoprenylcysteine O-methyltransferase Ste14|uniref:Protein-S-isoprenylcysteine O-methyltransferase Ste14 n=2 Tax=Thermosporothrix TaxID=768650 RepID=A0A326TYR1_THEHA|nr:isoprenylcysteine carboxylmethyltransferase family protein [Thermosporothrix hazakensis]PZW22389.1 protein-S-isoprenylcysteine O-methyltransferase Ste14 [Thermosporothrix hazakensis]BBH91091.1 hypothetical protein KTC_58420 [Thermosporothrix sp. COM3]GCE49143.1 hypothetical protein KTH_40120 [Thermosporothrix hazakensis]